MNDKKITVHQKTFDIAWGDMDALGHVNNARYFDYFQEARVDWLKQINISLAGQTGPVIVHAACTYFKPLIYPATVSIHSQIHSMGRSSMVMEHELVQQDVLMAQGICKIVWIDYIKGKSIALPEIIQKIFIG